MILKNRMMLILALVLAASSPGLAQTDSPWLYGVHWASNDTNDGDLEAMTGGKGVWVVDQALLNPAATAGPAPWETPWVGTDRTTPHFKPGYFSQIIAKGHTMIVRLQPYWACNIPHPSDPYTVASYANDCRAAADLMKNVHIWQIGNEVNLEGENRRWNTNTNAYDIPWTAGELATSPEQYAAMYVACRDRIHEITPTTTPGQQIVLMQPLSPGMADGERFMDSNEFLTRMIAAVPDKSKIDGFGLHSYAQPGGANFGTDGFMAELKQALMIIDQAGLGDRPVYITEFNKHMPNATEANVAAGFCTSAYQALHNWNTGPSQVLAGQPQHQIGGTAWFVYRGATWTDYSLRHWKDQIVSTAPAENPWYAFQSAATQNYAGGGTGSGTSFPTADTWWEDGFEGGTLDQTAPLPHWVPETGNSGQVSLTGGGAVRLIGAEGNPYSHAGIRTTEYAFSNFRALAEVTFTNASRIATDEANFDFRIREGSAGYSLTLYSSNSAGTSAARAGHVFLRKTGPWTTYHSAPVPGGINTGDNFRIEVTADGADLSYRITRLPGEQVVLDWTGANMITNSDQSAGGIRMMSYNMREARVDRYVMGGVTAPLVPAAVSDWALFD